MNEVKPEAGAPQEPSLGAPQEGAPPAEPPSGPPAGTIFGGGPAGAGPPGSFGGPGMPGGPGFPGGPGMGPLPPMPGQGPSGMAIAAFVLSLSGFFCGITAVPGFVMGLLEMGKIRRGESPSAGKGFALTAVIVGGIIVGLMVLYILFLIVIAATSFLI